MAELEQDLNFDEDEDGVKVKRFQIVQATCKVTPNLLDLLTSRVQR